MTVAPEARRTAVFNSGIENGLIGRILVGGQEQPNSGVGARLLWKNAQKKAKKKQISDKINRIMPNRRQSSNGFVCRPFRVLSRVTSRHH